MICLSSAGSLASFDGGSIVRVPKDSMDGGTLLKERTAASVRDGATRGPNDQELLTKPNTSECAPVKMRHHVASRRRSLLKPARAEDRSPSSRRPRSGTCARRAPRRVEAPLEETCSQAEPGSASCVQRFDDSLNSAIRTTYRISLRSSSLREPRYPSTRVVCLQFLRTAEDAP